MVNNNFFYDNTFCPKCGHLAFITNTHFKESADYINRRFWEKSTIFYLCSVCVHSWLDEVEKDVYFTNPPPE